MSLQRMSARTAYPALAAIAFLAGIHITAACSDGRDDGEPTTIVGVGSTGTMSSSNGQGGANPSATSSVGGAAGVGGSTSGAGGSGGSSALIEDCFDGYDNDLNGFTDCQDPQDPACAAICADSCAAPRQISDPTVMIKGDSTSHPALTEGSSCASLSTPHGPAHVYELTVAQTGVLEAELTSAIDFTLSIRTACSLAAGEIGCSERATGLSAPYFEFVKTPVLAGDVRYIVVEGFSLLEYGSYELSVESRPVTCGDANIDLPEECDDGGITPGDGCSATCTLEATETESNDVYGDADPFTAPWYGMIASLIDEDWVSLTILDDHSSIVVNTFDLGNGGCAKSLIDTALHLYDNTGMNELAMDNDGGDNYCSRLVSRGLSSGTYYIRTKASQYPIVGAPFAYKLSVEMDQCGNGTIGGAEECDDGDMPPEDGDGCSALCMNE